MAELTVAVLFGGRNGEHEVSCRSAEGVLSALDPARYDVVPVRISREGRWHVDGGDGTGVFAALEALTAADVVFPLLHGPFGEDGTVQAALESHGIRYVGSGVLASAVGMDKDFTKRLLAANGIAVADSVVLREPARTVTGAEREALGLPVFVKPARAGSSVGLSKVDDWGRLAEAVGTARAVDRKVLVERAVPGREIDLGVLEHPDGSLAVSPALEIGVPDRGVFDYQAKYGDAGTVFTVPAVLPEPLAGRLRELSVLAFRALGCRGLLRVDFLLDHDGEPVVNEVNTMPGFTGASQYPRMWRAAGIDYRRLLDVLIETALRR
ncbi:D-alanine--D-alanine ligase family protein [Actinosynnema sp. NPDC047251]|uniref:D-alanine--D-alanine ligase n=1 Tax=Saccharothrix espanaensis (strain ATCC 51144 / DSM 44229 / JCM 9112 / NBRC 15066 / NRRL 15764) TaxID=1179773 RepID=K0K1N0_SACES|nr:D-alanine--D-alanine ligase family protein [Saccharothrix espanaensis]CCH30774.1 D-alanine-D-alanine ligase [Saccharothrix espanaensis DSM 44229]